MAKVIRGGARVVRAEVLGARAKAAAILEAARAEAEATRESLRAELEREADAAAKAALAKAMLGVELAREEAVRAVHGEVAELALAVARRIVGETLAAEPGRVRALVDEALARVRRARRALVRVHPDDAPYMEGVGVDVVHDPSLGRGDCIVECDLGDVDGRIETRLAALARALEDTEDS